jgi:cation:H+ antiporter
MTLTILTLVGGLVLLVLGGELLVRGSVRVAEKLGVSPLLIGLTLVGFGTSTPELVTSVEASMIGSPGIAVGNIVGSNIANILLILGASALIYPLTVSGTALKRDGSIVILTGLLMAAAGFTVGLNHVTGIAFVAALVGYMLFAYRQERNSGTVEAEGHTAAFDRGEAFELAEPGLRPRAPVDGALSWAVPILMAVAGLAIIIFGGRILVDSAVELARTLGLSEAVIGLTIVAVGTSLPEFVTSVLAAIRRQTDIAVGNVLGSNIYNILGIGGVTGLIAPTGFPPEMLQLDLFVMIGASVLLFLFALNGRISRWEGGLMLAGYVAYVLVLLNGVPA